MLSDFDQSDSDLLDSDQSDFDQSDSDQSDSDPSIRTNQWYFRGQYICSCPEGLQYNHRDGVCEWPNARECCERSEDEGGLAHRPCETYASCVSNSDAGYCDRYDFDDEEDRFMGFLEDKDSCEYFYKVIFIRDP